MPKIAWKPNLCSEGFPSNVQHGFKEATNSGGHEDWSEGEFNACVVCGREGKRPLLVGDITCTVVNGAGFGCNVTFTDNSSWIRSRKFRLAVRAVTTATKVPGIKESHARNTIHHPWRIQCGIWGKYQNQEHPIKKLGSHGIKTVRDFLMQYHMDPEFLQNILGKGVSNRHGKLWWSMLMSAIWTGTVQLL